MADNGFWRVLDNYQLNTLLLNRFASRERLPGGRGPRQGSERAVSDGDRPLGRTAKRRKPGARGVPLTGWPQGKQSPAKSGSVV